LVVVYCMLMPAPVRSSGGLPHCHGGAVDWEGGQICSDVNCARSLCPSKSSLQNLWQGYGTINNWTCGQCNLRYNPTAHTTALKAACNLFSIENSCCNNCIENCTDRKMRPQSSLRRVFYRNVPAFTLHLHLARTCVSFACS
jgi:hypothetical protein